MPDVLVGQGFGGIGVCLSLAGHIPDLGCDTVQHHYLIRLRERTMAEETTARIEQMEKNQQELQEILDRDCEKHCEQMN